MAKYDHGGGCPCGLYKECTQGCSDFKRSRDDNMINTFENIEDFGFTAKTPEEIAAPVIADSSTKVDALLKAIMPLLNNLAKDPEKDTIHWPGRKAKIEAFIAKLNGIAGKPLDYKLKS